MLTSPLIPHTQVCVCTYMRCIYIYMSVYVYMHAYCIVQVFIIEKNNVYLETCIHACACVFGTFDTIQHKLFKENMRSASGRSQTPLLNGSGCLSVSSSSCQECGGNLARAFRSE